MLATKGMTMSTWTFEYAIDKDDIITGVNEAFCAFARENGAVDLPDTVMGTRLEQHLHGEPVLALWHDILEAVRASGEPLELPFRCDSPEVRRYMRMRIEPTDAGGLHFYTRSEREVRFSQPIALLDAHASHLGQLVRLCAWCKAVLLPSGEWVDIEEGVTRLGLLGSALGVDLTHGVCPTCEARLLAALEELEQGSDVPA